MKRTYERNRNKTLMIRLTEDEKASLVKRAKARNLSVTDFILASAIDQYQLDKYKPIIKMLGDIKSSLQKLNSKDTTETVCDALAANQMIYDEILRLLKNELKESRNDELQ